METLISQHPAVAAAIIFGCGRAQNGVLIQPRAPFDPINESQLEAFRNALWCALLLARPTGKALT